MIGAMSAGPSIMIVLILGGITTYYLTKLIMYVSTPLPDVRIAYSFDKFDRRTESNEDSYGYIDIQTENNQDHSRNYYDDRSENLNQNSLTEYQKERRKSTQDNDRSLTEYLKDLFDFI